MKRSIKTYAPLPEETDQPGRDQERSVLVTTCCGVSEVGVAPPQEMSNKEAQAMLINRMIILNMARKLAD